MVSLQSKFSYKSFLFVENLLNLKFVFLSVFWVLVKDVAAFYRVFFEHFNFVALVKLFAAFYRVFFETLSLVLLF